MSPLPGVKCPFCRRGEVPEDPGKHVCPECGGAFELDEQVVYTFVDLDKPMMPLKGTYCTTCGLIQSPHRKSCYLCETPLEKKGH